LSRAPHDLVLCSWRCNILTFIFTSFMHVHKSSCLRCIHKIHLMHIHAIGVPRIVIRAKSRWAWNLKLNSVREPEVQSDETGEDVGIVLEAEPRSLFFRLRQATEHYKPPTFKAIIYIYRLYVLLHYMIGVGWKTLLHW
jgi:hypothetical protein